MLLAWLFGIAMGVANACALGESAPHRADSATTAESQTHHHGNEQGDAAKVNCLDFCEKSSIAAPQLKLVGQELAVLGFALPVCDAAKLSGVAGTTVNRMVVDSPHLPGGPPPRIAFKRLSL